jgi:hypothetical protein
MLNLFFIILIFYINLQSNRKSNITIQSTIQLQHYNYDGDYTVAIKFINCTVTVLNLCCNIIVTV